VRQALLGVGTVARTADIEMDSWAIAKLYSERPACQVAACDMAGRRHAALEALAGAVASRLQGPTPDNHCLVAAAPGEYFVGRVLAGAGISGAPFWPAGRPDLRIEPRFVSRSALKLCEAIGLFSIPLVNRGTALDLGAAPGGWTQVLAGRGIRVTAVDPGELDPGVARLHAVQVFRGTAQAFVQAGVEQYDVVVDDMRLDARESARLLVAMRPRLRPGAVALITLKLPERAPSSVLKAALAALGVSYAVLGVRCLYFNRSEVTVYARAADNDPYR
jgi:23S rRNA C2498 (ribose-2'-O)-methylase RlmM